MKTSLRLINLLVFSGISLVASAQTQNALPSSGDVGIGTTSPSSKLQVCGRTTLDSTVTVRDTLRAERDVIIDQNLIVNGQVKFGAYTDTARGVLFVDENGSMLRGGHQFLANIAYLEDCFLLMNPDGTNQQVPAPSWASLGTTNYGILYTGANCPARVGIGTNNPLAQLDVRGNQYLTGKLSVGQGTDNSAYNFYLKNTDVNNNNILLIENGQNQLMRLRVNNSGKGLLEVNEIIVRLSPFPDYVFESEYKLMSLDELKKYIEINGKLPNYPNAKEVEENGMGVSELLLKQQEKIEELTLYLLQLKEELDELKNTVKK
jgi:hypothetical protein